MARSSSPISQPEPSLPDTQALWDAMRAKGLPAGLEPEAQARWDAIRAEVGPSRLSRRTAYLALVAYVEDFGPGWPTAEISEPLSNLQRGLWQDGDTADPAARFDWYRAVLCAVSGKPPTIALGSDDAGPEQTADEWLDVLELFLRAIWKRAGDVHLADVLSWIREPYAPVSSIETTPWELWSFPWSVVEIESVRGGQLLRKPNG
jgi:hypothetical protein